MVRICEPFNKNEDLARWLPAISSNAIELAYITVQNPQRCIRMECGETPKTATAALSRFVGNLFLEHLVIAAVRMNDRFARRIAVIGFTRVRQFPNCERTKRKK